MAMSCFTVRGVCEGTLAGNWDLDVQWADSRVTSWSLCPGNSLLEWGHDRWFTFIVLNMAKGMECHIYNCLKKDGTICFTLSLTGFVKASGCAGELGPQHGQTARSWDLSLTAGEVEFFNNHAPPLNEVIAFGASWLAFVMINTARMISWASQVDQW